MHWTGNYHKVGNLRTRVSEVPNRLSLVDNFGFANGRGDGMSLSHSSTTYPGFLRPHVANSL